MKKKLKNVVFTFMLLSMCSLGINTVFAAETNELAASSKNASATFEMVKGESNNDNSESIVDSYILIQGPAGYARLDYVYGGQAIEWQVCPATTGGYFFVGDLEIVERDTGDVVGGKTLSAYGCSGVETGQVDLVRYDMTRGRYYYAILSGIATDVFGQTYEVVKNAKLVFCY